MHRPAPLISVVVILFNMEREGRRTLYSLSTSYQADIRDTDYEVIVVDNGSRPPFPSAYVESVGRNFTYVYLDDARPSPASAINLGVRQSRGEYVCIMIDGARMLTPGMLRYAVRAIRAFEHPIVTSPSWHLGPDLQRRAIKNGYSEEVEDALLARIGWPGDGYRLFEIATPAASSKDGWFLPMGDSACLFMARSDYERMGGCDERFDAPGGGHLSRDTYRRACALDDTELVVLLGEGTFHQLHGGISTNVSEERFADDERAWTAQYVALRGEPHTRLAKAAHYLGHIPPQARQALSVSAEKVAAHGRQTSAPREGQGKPDS
jgi:hypothetical protein